MHCLAEVNGNGMHDKVPRKSPGNYPNDFLALSLLFNHLRKRFSGCVGSYGIHYQQLPEHHLPFATSRMLFQCTFFDDIRIRLSLKYRLRPGHLALAISGCTWAVLLLSFIDLTSPNHISSSSSPRIWTTSCSSGNMEQWGYNGENWSGNSLGQQNSPHRG